MPDARKELMDSLGKLCSKRDKNIKVEDGKQVDFQIRSSTIMIPMKGVEPTMKRDKYEIRKNNGKQ